MKPGSTFLRTLLVLLLLLVAGAGAFGDELTVNMVARVLQSFDPDEAGHEDARNWVLLPSKFGYDSKGNSFWQTRKVDAWPESLYGKNRDKEKLQVLGITGKFSRKGYNYVEIVPGTGEGQSFKPKPIPIPGRVESLDVWVWGANYAYYLEAHVRDFQGIDHVLPFGLLQFTGWKNLRCQDPGQHPAGLEVPAPPAQPGADQAGAVDPARREGRRVLHVPRPAQGHHRPVRNHLRRRRAGRRGRRSSRSGDHPSHKEELRS